MAWSMGLQRRDGMKNCFAVWARKPYRQQQASAGIWRSTGFFPSNSSYTSVQPRNADNAKMLLHPLVFHIAGKNMIYSRAKYDWNLDYFSR
jgi:hypothetical protein